VDQGFALPLVGSSWIYNWTFQSYTGPTTEPDTICSYVLNAANEKVPHVDVCGEMKVVLENVRGMHTQFERVMQKMKEAQTTGSEKKCKAKDDVGISLNLLRILALS
jgi:hypothetical protein